MTFPNTSAGIHLGLVFDYRVHDPRTVARRVDYVFGGYFADWHPAIDPKAGHVDGSLPFDLDGYPQYVPGHSLLWWQAHHPGWIVYRCDRKTPAYDAPGTSNVPLDITNPSVRAYEIQEVAGMFARGASGAAFDDFSFSNSGGRCGVYRGGEWRSLHYPAPAQDSATLNNDMRNWLKSIREELRRRFPTKTLAVDMNLRASGIANVRAVAPYVDMVLDESGFTSYGTGGLMSTAWQQEVGDLEYLASLGKAVDVNAIVNAASNSSVTRSQLSWALGNYLLVKGAHSYTYVYATGDRSSLGVGSSGYGTFYDRPQYHIPIGAPTSGRFSSYGVQMRYYAGGLVIVNPSSWQTFAVPLGQAYTDMFGTPYTAVTLSPASAIVLVNPS